ncbi:hypothetical protein CJ739_1722 [Mariniflexile rhizosphaerae]|uniref:hypothetical protein n=1 Tax=unclassified Mariniflexile TaxID=2643887 RepID=UPI000CBDB354|nr:hypothetical protein [Mariniflexile sp. TRM1-10]AXP80808.1 hypothetical protein CJ739_1722 [Mariniflexile sp. TRM1-10]PLB17648.1 MAG: hypothetical protein TRG1_3498 [Flavobacteriaceae bacterium FS1-H7996/R]
MKIRIIIFSFVYFFILKVNAQNVAKVENNLIGQWQFIKMVDTNNKKLKPFVSSTNYSPKFRKIFPDIVFSKKGKIIIDPDHKTPLKANWNWISDSEIEIIETLDKDSDRFKFPDDSMKIKRERELDGKGNYILRDTFQIEWIKKTKIKIYRGEPFFRIYKKNRPKNKSSNGFQTK